MAPQLRGRPQTVDLLDIRDKVDQIASQLDDANTIQWPAALLGQGENHAQKIQQSVEQLLGSAQRLVKTINQKQRLSRSKASSQQIEPDGYYTGRVKIGLAQLKRQTVFTNVERLCSEPIALNLALVDSLVR